MTKKYLKLLFSKTLTFFVVLTTILWSLGLILIFPEKTEAAVTERTPADEIAMSGDKIKASSGYVALFGFGLTKDAGEKLNSVTVQINNTTGIISSDFAGLYVFSDTGSTDDAIDGTDTLCGSQTTVNVGSTTTIDTSAGGGCTIPAATGNYDFIVAIKTSATAGNGDTFAYQVPGGPTTYILTVGNVVATGLSMPNIAIDAAGPQVAGGGPPDGQIGAPVEAMIDRALNETPASGTVTTSTVLLKTNTGNVQGGAPTGDNLCTSVTLNNTQIICSHAALSPEIWYTLTITTGVTDLAGNPMASNFTAQFKTGSFGGGMQFNPPPFVTGSYPSAGKDLPVNSKIMINFSSAMKTSGQGSVLNQANVPLYELASNGTITGANLLWEANLSYSSDNKQLTVSPPLTPPFPGAPVLTVGTRYRFMVRADNDVEPGNSSCGGESGLPACVMNTYGLALPGKNFEIDFTVIAADNTAPQVVGSYPDNGATGVDKAVYDIAISFNEALDPVTITTSNIKLYQDNNSDGLVDGGDTLITGTTVILDADGRVIHLSPNQILTSSKKFIINLTNGIKDIVGNALSTTNRTFTTGTSTNGEAPDSTEPTVMFASADNFSIAITFSEPMKFDATANTTESSSNGVNNVNNLSNWTIETSPDGTNWMTNPVTSGKQVKYEPYKKTLTIKGMAMPPGNSFKATASTNIQDLVGNGMDSGSRIAQGTALSAQNTGGMLGPGESAGGTNYFNMGTRPISVYPKSPMAGSTTGYRVEFPADTAITGSGKITLTFPTGFSFAATCNTWPTSTFENADINGQAPNTVSVASIVCDSVSRVVTITLGANGTNAGDMLRFEIQGVVNSTVPKDYSTSGYIIDIKTYNASNALLESKSAMPFFINTPGSRTISGIVFNDNGAGAGTADNGTKDGSEPGVQSIRVCLGGPSVGFQCVDTDVNGAFSFSQLNDGSYHLELPPISSGAYTGGPFFRNLNVSGSNLTSENFGLKQASANFILTVAVSGTGLTGTKIDVFAFSTVGTMEMGAGGPAAGGYVMRECTIGTDCNAVQLPLTQGKWQVSVGPWMPKDPGAPPMTPDFSFMPPKPTEIQVGSSGIPDTYTCSGTTKKICFTLTASSNQIKGKVVDGSGNAISNVFVMARPTVFEGTGPMSAGASQTDSNGLFDAKVVTGSYIVEAYMPGMPPSNSFQCTVKDNTGASDNNSTADVYCNGVLIINDVTGFSSSAVTGTITENDLIFKIAKSGTSVSGRVLDDSSNPIAFAHVEAMEVDGSGNPLGGWADSPTDNSGNYTLYLKGGTSTTPKNWKIRGFAPGFGELPSLTVAVVENTNLTDKNLQATTADFGTVTGAVTSGGAGVQGAFIGIHGASGGNGIVTDESGNYSIKVRAGSGYTIDGFVPSKGPTTQITGVTVTAGSTLSSQNLTIAQAGTISVYLCTLTTPGSTPNPSTNPCASRQVTSAFVDARDSSGRGNSTGSNPTAGQYDLMVPAGTYTVFAGGSNIGPIGSQANVVVTANATTYLNFAPPAMYTVSGAVTSSDSACIEGATVFLNEKTNGRMILSQVNSSGAWSASNVPNGSYTIGAGKPGCVDSADPDTLAVSGANATATQRTLTKADATISGSVTLSGSNVSFDTMISATSGTGKMVVTMVDTSQTSGTNYTLNVTAGTWSVMARTDGYESSSSSVTVASGGSATQNITLSAIAGYTRQEPMPYSIKPSQGGIVRNTDISSDFEVNIPAGVLGSSSNDGSVLTKETTAVVDTSTQDVLGNKGIEVTPKDASGQPITTISSSDGSGVTITIPYNPNNLPAGSGEDDIVLAAWSDEKQQWEPLSTTCDTTNNKCTATTTHFSTFAPIVATGGGAPSTPSGLSATAASSSQINLSWTVVSGATSYDIYRDTSAGGSFPRLGSEPTISSGSTTTYSDTGLTASTTYYYKISALNDSGESTASSAVSATTSGGGGGGGGVFSDVAAPSISDIKTSVGSTSATITWKTNEASLSWIVYGLTTDYGKESKSTIYITSHSVTLSDLSASTTYHYQIKSKDSAGNVGTYTDQTFTTSAAGGEVETPTTEEKPVSKMTVAELQAKIAEILTAIQSLQSQLSAIQGTPGSFGCTVSTLARTLKQGDSGEDIKCLQKILNSDPETTITGTGPGSPGNETTYFGPLTRAAVIKFQEKYSGDILVPLGFSKGTGMVAKMTLMKLNSLLGK